MSLGTASARTPLQAARFANGWSQRELMRRLRHAAAADGRELPGGTSLQSQVSSWETGRVTPSAFYQRLLCRTYDTAPAELGFVHAVGPLVPTGNQHDEDEEATSGSTASTTLLGEDRWTPDSTNELAELLGAEQPPPVTAVTASRLAHEWLIAEPPQIVEVAAGRHVGDGLLQKVEDRVHQLRRMDDVIGGGDLHGLVERELRATITLLRDAVSGERLGERFLAVVAELCQLAGWVAGDAGHYHAAQRYYAGGIKAAYAASDRPLAGNIISTLSYQTSNVGNPHDAVLLAHTAYQGAHRSASATTRALLQERIAWAHARAGNPRHCEKALGEVDEAFGRRRPDDDPAWVYWLDQDEIDVMAGRCHAELRRPTHAEPLLRRVLDRYDDARAREVSLYSTWLAEIYLQLGEAEHACAVATRALRLAVRVASARSLHRVEAVRGALATHGDSAAVRDFQRLYSTLTG